MLDLPAYDREVIDQQVLRVEDVDAMVDRIVAMLVARRLDLPYLHPGRADVIDAGAMILSRVLRRVRTDTMVVSRPTFSTGSPGRWSAPEGSPTVCRARLDTGSHERSAPLPADEPLGAIVHRLTEQVPELVRSEMRLAQAELTEKGKAAGLGIGLFSVAGIIGLFASGR